LNYYANFKSINEDAISEAFMKHSNWDSNLPFPYCVKASDKLLSKFNEGFYSGITATAPGFYGPQGRQIRLKAAKPNLNELLTDFNFDNKKISNFEMETSALYGLGKLLGHECLTVCVIIANRVRKEFTSDYKKSVEVLIESCLSKI
jgi:uridine phosphorylase